MRVVPAGSPGEPSVQAAFAAQLARTPDAVAVRADDRDLTYRELDERANRLARRLLDLGVQPEAPVAVLMDRSAALVVGLLAVLKAGGCYLPLHHGYPAERRQWIVRETGARVLLCDEAGRARGLPSGCTAVSVDDADTTGFPATDPGVSVHPGQLAYVMYTSGSTGTPKGVAVSHRNVLDLAGDGMFGAQARERVLMIAPYAFDPSTYELWVPLLHGGRVVVAPEGELTVAALARLVTEERITGLQITAGLFRVVAEDDPGCLAGVREVITGGDIVSPAAVRRVLEQCPETVVRCAYGPTETTLFATQHPWTKASEVPAPVPIGLPLDGMRAYVLDASLRPADAGAEGELYLAGAGSARGYLGRPDLTAERFVPDPFGPPGARMYRTGDLARRSPASPLLEFVGRADDQVKIRGFRVEIGEVEAALGGHPDLAQAAVAAHDDLRRGKQLAAYVVPRPASSGPVEPEVLRRHLARTLPEYMVPATISVLDRLPLTANGKVDYRALPAPAPVAGSGRGPRSPHERILCELFSEVLGVPGVGIDDSFFELGGHSLLATRLAGRVRSVLGMRLSIRSLLKTPTVAALAAGLEDGDSRGGGLEPVLRLRPSGTRPPLFCVHPGSGIAWCYAGLLRYLPREFPVYGLQARGLSPDEPPARDFDALVEDCLGRIRDVRPTGPYALLGWSFGGKAAHALAARLRAEGEEVSMLAVVDAEATGRGVGALPELPPRDLLSLAFDGITAFHREPGDGPLPIARVQQVLRESGSTLGGLDARTVSALIDVTANNRRIGAAGAVGRFDGALLSFEAVGPDGLPTGLTESWEQYVTGPLERHTVPFPHMEMMQADALTVIGPILARTLRERCAH